MRSLLHLLPQYRAMAKALDDASTRALRAEDIVRTRDEECRWLREQLVLSHQQTLSATQALANLGLQRAFGFRMFADAPAMPMGQRVEQEPGMLTNPRKATFDARAQAVEDFKREGLKQFNQAHGIDESDAA